MAVFRERKGFGMKRILIDLAVWLQWTLATATGFGLGSFISFILTINIPNDTLYLVAFGLLLFAWVGTMQWIVLSWRLQRVGWWVPVTMAGWLLGGYIGLYTIGDSVGTALDRALGEGVGDIAKLALQGALIGFTVGFFQWIVLRRHVQRAGWWILTSGASVLLSMLIVDTVVEGGDHLEFLFAVAFFGSLVGATSAIPIAWMLRYPLVKERTA